MKKLFVVSVLLFLLLAFVPMLIPGAGDGRHRSFERTTLGEVAFTEIQFRNEAQDLQLAGMLFTPEGSGPFPAAVIIHGSGSSRRDNGWYLTLTKFLRDNGVLVVLPDKRGSEQSAGDWRTAGFRDLATDTLAAIGYLQGQQEVPVSGIGIIGLSQGGQIAPLVASMTDEISYVINIVGGAVPMHEQLVYEENYNLRQMGMLPGFSNLFAHVGAWSLIRFRQREFWSAVGNFDPVPYWRELGISGLVLYGENDTNVPSQRSAEVLHALENPTLDIRVYPGSGHALESPEGSGNSVFRPDALEDIREFIQTAVSPAGKPGLDE